MDRGDAFSAGEPRPVRVGLVSLGCPKNLIDSEVMLGRLAGSNVEIVSRLEDADVVVVNTCTFIEAAKRESIETILEMTELKESGTLRAVIVTGCLAQRYAKELLDEIPDLDAIVGVTAEDALPSLLKEIAGASAHEEAAAALDGPRRLPMAPVRPGTDFPPGPRVIVRDPSRPFGAEVGRLRLTPRHYAYLRIAEGCDHACSFCAIPRFRGRFRSKPEADILVEARELARDGARELCLIAEDTNQYGQDRRDGSSLASLLYRLAEIDGIEWLRILYAYPAYFPKELVRAVAEIPKVAKYIDIPLQHVSDDLLRRMNRPGKQQTIDLLNRLRDGIPGLGVRTTFIVGFPGETKEHFAELLEFVREFRFERLGAFTYSLEEGTPAADLPGAVGGKAKRSRRSRLMAAQRRIAFRKNRSLVGTVVRAIIDTPEGKGRAIGRTEHDAPEIDGTIKVCERGRNFRAGEMLAVRVMNAEGYDLEGEPA